MAGWMMRRGFLARSYAVDVAAMPFVRPLALNKFPGR